MSAGRVAPGVRVAAGAGAAGRTATTLLRALGVPLLPGAGGDAAVSVAVTPCGDDAPRAAGRGGERVAQALGGLVWPNGAADGPPLPLPGAPVTRAAAVHAALGALLGLLAWRRDGRARHVDVCLQESATALLEHVMGEWFDRADLGRRRGSLHWNGTFRIGRAADAAVLLSHVGDWTALREWLLADGVAVPPAWADVDTRCRDAAQVFAVLDAWAVRYPAAELVARAQALRLPFAPVRPRDGRESVAPGWLRRAGGGPAAATTVDDGEAAQGTTAPLAGVRVVDFTWVVAGPLATRVLADFGAVVTRVERPDAPPPAGTTAANLRRGKQRLGLDPGTRDGREQVRALLRDADVVVDNFSRRVLPNWGLDAAALHALNPRLVVAHLAGFPADGACADWVSFAPTLQAFGGLAAAMPGPDGAPCGPGFALADTAAGWALALAVVAALWRRGARGRGAVIDLAQLDVLTWLTAGRDAPGAVYRCADDARGERWVLVEGDGDATRLRRQAADAAVAELQAAGVPAAVVATPADLAVDPLLRARGWWAVRDGVVMDGVVPRLVL